MASSRVAGQGACRLTSHTRVAPSDRARNSSRPMKYEVFTDVSVEGLARANQLSLEGQWIARGGGPGCEVYDGPDLLRVSTGVPSLAFNCVVRVQLEPEEADRKIDETHAYFDSRNVAMFWLVAPSSRPSDLGDRLVAHGASFVEDQPAMGVDLGELRQTHSPPAGLAIEHVDDQESLRRWGDAFAAGMGTSGLVHEGFVRMNTDAGYGGEEGWRHYTAVLNGEPVGTASLFLGRGVAGIQAVGTIPKARRQGIGTAVTLAALNDALERGYRIGVLGSSEMAHSMYERMGFRECAKYGMYIWGE